MKMRTPLILTQLKKYSESNAARFHMPGHKGNEEFLKHFCGAADDITELSFSGCLFSDSGLTFEAEKQMAEVLGARRTFIVTDGSTCSILSMFYALSRRGSKVILPRNCHKSAYNALKLFNLQPVFLKCRYEDGIILQDISGLEDALKDGDVAGLVLISPDYYGSVPDLKTARELTKKYGKLLIIDGAHGAHMRFSAPEIYAGNFADAWVDGVHKTLPTLTQGALLNVNNTEIIPLIEEGLNIFRTTSPSYPIMASCEYGVYYAESVGERGYNELFKAVDNVLQRLKLHGYAFKLTQDRAKLLLDCVNSQIDCGAAVGFLESRGVFSEFTDGRYIVFMVSVMTTVADLERLVSALILYKSKVQTETLKINEISDNVRFTGDFPRRALNFADAARAEWELVPKEKAAGRISYENVGIFPPCYPLVTAGEIIENQTLELLSSADNVFGLTDGMFKVVKEEK